MRSTRSLVAPVTVDRGGTSVGLPVLGCGENTTSSYPGGRALGKTAPTPPK